MHLLFHIHPSLKDSLPLGSEERLWKVARALGEPPTSFRIFVGPGIDGLRARVELRTRTGLRHRFVSNAPSGTELVSQLETRLQRVLCVATVRAEVA